MTENHLKALPSFIQDSLGLPKNFTCNVELVDSASIQALNQSTRNIDTPTDCLSLPLYESLEEAKREAEVLSDEFSLGDIVICEEIANKKTYPETSLDVNPIEICLVHGYLHLLGYDHITEADAAVMEELEDEILQAWTRVQDGSPPTRG